jgi:cbb3-type cytochrome oxidase maturation protein
MLEHLTLGEFVVALLMGGAALCAFVWGAMSGAFRDIEAIKHQVLHVEDEANGAPGSSRRPPTGEPASRTPLS